MDVAETILRAIDIAGPPAPVIKANGQPAIDPATGEAKIETAAEHEARIAYEAKRIISMTSPSSRLGKQVEQMMGARPFVGDITNAKREESSNRMAVTISAYSPRKGSVVDQVIRTERIERPEGRLMARLALSLVGHRVLIYKVTEEKADGSGDKANVLVHLEDLGPTPEDKS